MAASLAKLEKLCQRKLDRIDLVAILIDGIYGKQLLAVALPLKPTRETGARRQGATESTSWVKHLRNDSVAGG